MHSLNKLNNYKRDLDLEFLLHSCAAMCCLIRDPQMVPTEALAASSRRLACRIFRQNLWHHKRRWSISMLQLLWVSCRSKIKINWCKIYKEHYQQILVLLLDEIPRIEIIPFPLLTVSIAWFPKQQKCICSYNEIKTLTKAVGIPLHTEINCSFLLVQSNKKVFQFRIDLSRTSR
jgi:hypothetical protein